MMHMPRPTAKPRAYGGFTLVEMMVAMVLAIIVAAGIISLFVSTSRANRVQNHLAHIQENGRYAVARLSRDLRMGNAQYCSSSGGQSNKPPTGKVYQPQFRSPTVFAKILTLSDGSQPLSAASIGAAYAMPADLFLAGSECSATSCSPAVAASVPAMGTTAGKRVKGADVLSLRYLSGDGWSLGIGHSTQTCDSSNLLTSITLAPAGTVEPPASDFKSGDLAMLADCSLSQVFAVTVGATTLTPTTTGNFATPACVVARNGGRLFDFNKDFVTVTYFLELKADDNPDASAGHLVSVLMRKVNESAAQPVVRGVERFDLRYEVENNLGQIALLTADQVENGDPDNGGSLSCPPGVPTDLRLPAAVDTHCLWRAIKAINVNLLLDSVDTMPSLPEDELAYLYPPDGSSISAPPTTMSNGLDRQMMRRSFNFVVTLRNYNP